MATVDPRLYSLQAFVPWRDPRFAKYGSQIFVTLTLLVATPMIMSRQLGLALRAVPAYARFVPRTPDFFGGYAPIHLLRWYVLLFGQLFAHPNVARPILQAHGRAVCITVGCEIVAFLLMYQLLYWTAGKLLPDYHGAGRMATQKELESAQVFSLDGSYAGFFPFRIALSERFAALREGKVLRALTGIVNRIVRIPADMHMILFGGTGTGKTQDIILTTLATWQGSIFAYALKSEIISKSAGFRASDEGMRSELHVMILAEPDPKYDGALVNVPGSPWEGGCNPLDIVHCYDDAVEVTIAIRSETMGSGKLSGDMSNSFFTVSATEYCNILFTWMRAQYGADAHLALALQLIARQRTPIDLLVAMAKSPHDPYGRKLWYDSTGALVDQDPTVADLANKMIVNLTADQQQSVVQNASTYLSPWNSRWVARATQRTTFNPDDFRDPNKSVSFYVFSPYVRKKALAPVVSVCTHAFLRMVARGDSPHRTAKGRTMVVLDEADSLHVPVIDEDINELRSTGITFLLSYQAYRMVLGRYGPHERIRMACGAAIYFRPKDPETYKDLAASSGRDSVRAAAPPNNAGHDYGHAFHDISRTVVEEEEARRIPIDRGIAVLDVPKADGSILHPIYMGRGHATNEPEFRYRIEYPLPWETP